MANLFGEKQRVILYPYHHHQSLAAIIVVLPFIRHTHVYYYKTSTDSEENQSDCIATITRLPFQFC